MRNQTNRPVINLFNFMLGCGLPTHIKAIFDLIWTSRNNIESQSKVIQLTVLTVSTSWEYKIRVINVCRFSYSLFWRRKRQLQLKFVLSGRSPTVRQRSIRQTLAAVRTQLNRSQTSDYAHVSMQTCQYRMRQVLLRVLWEREKVAVWICRFLQRCFQYTQTRCQV